MKLVIDIPEEDYEWINTHRSVTDYQTTKMLYKRVLNGTPFDTVIEDITHEITKYLEDVCINENEAEGIMFCLDVMDKHISGKETE